MGEFGWGGGGGLSFGDADVVPFTFDIDFPEGLSCRESTVEKKKKKKKVVEQSHAQNK